MDNSKFKIKKIKNNTFYQDQPLTILEIERKDDENITRKQLIKLCVQLKEDLKSMYHDGLISVSIQYPNRWYSGNVSKLTDDKINFFSMDQYDEYDEDPEEYTRFRFNFIPF